MADGRAHVLVVPYSTTGHTNPLFQFAKNLASRGLIVTFVSLNFDHPKILQAKDSILRLGFDVRLESIPDEIPRDVAIDAAHINDFLFKHVHDHMRGSGLEELIQRLNANGDDVSCIIYDSFMPWVPRIARKFNIPHAFFWTQSASVFNIYYHFKHVQRWNPDQRTTDTVKIPCLPELNIADLPSSFLPPRYPTGLDIGSPWESNSAAERMESKDGFSKPHVVVLSYPATGHTNPILQFSKNLASRDLLVTFVNFGINHHIMLRAKDSLQRLGLDIRFESIADNLPQAYTPDSNIIQYVFKHINDMDGSGLEVLIERLNAEGPPVSCIVYDSFLPWVRDVANKLNIPRAFFWTQSSAVFSIYHHFKHVEKWDPDRMPETVTIPVVGELNLADMPRHFFPPAYTAGLLYYFLKELDSVAGASWVLVNSFYELEPETIDYLQTFLPILPIGPSIPSAFLDRRCPEDTKVGANLWKDADCLEWLDSKAPSSVVYISFGSITSISPRQIHELAVGIERSQQNFVWVIRPPQGQRDVREVFPVGFVEESKGRGLIVQWCAQLEVLSHPSVAAFMSHCGWNSSLDGLSLGVPMLTFGMWTDQNTNAKCLSDVWKMGLRMRKGEDGIVGREEVERCIRLAVNSKEIAELKKNGLKWKELAKRAMMEGGSSDTNLNSFVQQIVAKAAVA